MAKPAPSTALPARSLDAKLLWWGENEILYRVHDAEYAVDSFNPSPLDRPTDLAPKELAGFEAL